MISGIETYWIQEQIEKLVFRFKIAALAFVQAPSLKPILKTRQGIEIDLSCNKIIFPDTIHLHSQGDFIISSDQHVMIDSGQKPEADRPGYMYSVWTNCPKDNFGRPTMDPKLEQMVKDQNDDKKRS